MRSWLSFEESMWKWIIIVAVLGVFSGYLWDKSTRLEEQVKDLSKNFNEADSKRSLCESKLTTLNATHQDLITQYNTCSTKRDTLQKAAHKAEKSGSVLKKEIDLKDTHYKEKLDHKDDRIKDKDKLIQVREEELLTLKKQMEAIDNALMDYRAEQGDKACEGASCAVFTTIANGLNIVKGLFK